MHCDYTASVVGSCTEMFRAFGEILEILHPRDPFVAQSWRSALTTDAPQETWQAVDVLGFLKQFEDAQRGYVSESCWLIGVDFHRWVSGGQGRNENYVLAHSVGRIGPGDPVSDFADIRLSKRHDDHGMSFYRLTVEGRETTVDKVADRMSALEWRRGYRPV